MREFHKKYLISTCRYKLFMMRQPKSKSMSHYINTLLEAAEIANIYELTPDKLLIILTLATCTDDALKQELIKLEANSMKEVQDEVNKWETRMNTASRMLSEKQQQAQQARTQRNWSNKTDTGIICYRCGGAHEQNICKIKREDVTCVKCNKQGHMTKVCKGGGKSNRDSKKDRNFARSTLSTDTLSTADTREPPPEYANAARSASSTPPLLL